MAKKRFPKTIYVTWQGEGENAYLAVTEQPEDDLSIDESTRCAAYDLAGEGTLTVTRSFEFGTK